MKNIISYKKCLILLINLLILFSTMQAFTHNKKSTETLSFSNLPNNPEPLKLPSSSYILVNVNSMNVLAESKSNKKLAPASLTKLLTLYIVEEQLKEGVLRKDDKVFVSKKAWSAEGSRMFLNYGKFERVDKLIEGLTIVSGNDAAIALAEHISGSEELFAKLMNDTASKIGMNDSHFLNATGLPQKGHESTAYDLALLAAQFQKRNPKFHEVSAKKEFTYNKIKQFNRNTLLWRDKTVNGMKTGHTKEAGYCLIASANRASQQLIAVSMGSPSMQKRNETITSLLNFGERSFNHITVQKDIDIADTTIWYGEETSAKPKLAHSFTVSFAKNSTPTVKKYIQVKKDVFAPFPDNTIIGYYKLKNGNKVIKSVPIIIEKGVKKTGFFGTIYSWFSYQIYTLESLIYGP